MSQATRTASKDESNERGKKENSQRNTLPDDADDSMADFKSPESKKLRSTGLPRVIKPTAKSKVKVEFNLKDRLNNQKEKRKRETSQRKKNTSKSQPSIESSFFKAKDTVAEEKGANDIKAGIVCPLCFKVCKDEESQALHMKICAIKYKLSTKQLMDVMELQKRQVEERRSLGLLTGPALQERKKQTTRRTLQAQHEDADLQLGLALSRSLREIEEVNEFNDPALDRETVELGNWSEKESKVIPQLEKFGFASTGKATATTKTRKRKLNEVTVLQTRSEVDRNRILAERIAEILVASDTVTQDSQQNTANPSVKEEPMLRSSFLKTLHCTKTYLWQASTLLSQQVRFYVNELSDYIAPCEGSLANNGDSQEVARGSPILIEQSEGLKNIETCETFGDQKRFYDISIRTTPRVSTGEITKEEVMNDKFGNSLALDWGRALNDSSASDMIINVSNGKRIWTHKLVFYIRCSNILLDVTTNEDSRVPAIKEKINWLDTPYDIALAFLEFIYCGRIEKYNSIMDEDCGVSTLRNMARKYRVQELFDYLRKSEPTKKQMNSRNDYYYNTEENTRNISAVSKSLEMNSSDGILNNKSPSKNTTVRESELVSIVPSVLPEADLEMALPPTPTNMISSKKGDPLESTQVKSIGEAFCNSINGLREEISIGNMSPDMFDDTEETASIFAENCISNEPMERIEECVRNGKMLTPKPSSPISINNTPKIPSNSPERVCVNDGKNSILSTPISTDPNRSKQRRSSLKKQRSNLSLFIEKFQKDNNKSDSDMDSDTSTIHNVEIKRNRNPFNLRQIASSSIHSDFQCAGVTEQSAPIKKIGLDALEYNLSDADTEPYISDSPNSIKNNPITEKESFDEEILAQLEFDFNLCTQKYSEKQDEVDGKCKTGQNTTKISGLSSVPNATNENIDLSQCETDEEEISMYTKYKKTHLQNSIADYRTMLKKKMDSLDSTKFETAAIDRSGNTSARGVSMTNTRSVTNEIEIATLSDAETRSSYVSFLSTERKSPNPLKGSLSGQHFEHSEKAYSDSGSDTDILYPDSPAGGETHNSRSGSPENNSIDGHLELLPENYDMPGGRASTLCMQENDRSIWKEQAKVVSEACNQEYNSREVNNETIRGGLLSPMIVTIPTLQSPVWVLSSPEISFKEMDNKTDRNEKAKSYQSDDDMDHIFEQEIYLANVRVDDDVLSEPPSPLNTSTSDGLIRYSLAKLHNSLESTLSTDGKSKMTGLNSSEFPRCEDALAPERLGARKLQRKSVSHGNFTVSTKSDSMPNLNYCNCYRQQMSELSLKKAARTEHSTTPPPDYQAMDTPKLHKELNKYGLKLQKRKRAVKLLAHIYNEMHPIVSPGEKNTVLRATSLESDDDDERLVKRMHHNSRNQPEENLSQDYSIADMPASDIVIAEERQVDEIEPVNTEVDSNVKARFLKLIETDRELYNKILSYEPLCLEELHSSLKADGLKCNKNTLMDFLDEQCITFYMQDNNRRVKARGASKENRRKKTGK